MRLWKHYEAALSRQQAERQSALTRVTSGGYTQILSHSWTLLLSRPRSFGELFSYLRESPITSPLTIELNDQRKSRESSNMSHTGEEMLTRSTAAEWIFLGTKCHPMTFMWNDTCVSVALFLFRREENKKLHSHSVICLIVPRVLDGRW